MATLTFGGPVFDGASNGVVGRDHADEGRVGRVPTLQGRLTAAPSPGAARLAVGRHLARLAVVLERRAPGPCRAGRAGPEEPSDGTAAIRAAARHHVVALRTPSPGAMGMAWQGGSRTRRRPGAHIVIALRLDDGRVSPW
jgi:hypothetical protein